MGMGAASTGHEGRHKRRRAPVMAEINVTPMVDVMLVLLIIFMVSAPLLTVGVPLDLPQSQAKSLEQENKEPLTVSVDAAGKVFLNNVETPAAEIVPKLMAIAEARGTGTQEKVYFRADKKSDYGTAANMMGKLSGAGFTRLVLVTEVEQ